MLTRRVHRRPPCCRGPVCPALRCQARLSVHTCTGMHTPAHARSCTHVPAHAARPCPPGGPTSSPRRLPRPGWPRRPQTRRRGALSLSPAQRRPAGAPRTCVPLSARQPSCAAVGPHVPSPGPSPGSGHSPALSCRGQAFREPGARAPSPASSGHGRAGRLAQGAGRVPRRGQSAERAAGALDHLEAPPARPGRSATARLAAPAAAPRGRSGCTFLPWEPLLSETRFGKISFQFRPL